MPARRTFVVVGASVAGEIAAPQLWEQGFDGRPRRPWSWGWGSSGRRRRRSVRASVSVDRARDVRRSRALIQQQVAPDAAALADPQVDLRALIPEPAG